MLVKNPLFFVGNRLTKLRHYCLPPINLLTRDGHADRITEKSPMVARLESSDVSKNNSGIPFFIKTVPLSIDRFIRSTKADIKRSPPASAKNTWISRYKNI